METSLPNVVLFVFIIVHNYIFISISPDSVWRSQMLYSAAEVVFVLAGCLIQGTTFQN